jgi:hypothetical protein
MKQLLLPFFCFSILVFAACKKDITNSDAPPIVIAATDKLLSSGTFTNGAHTVTGSVKLIQSADNKKYLIFDNLKTDSGPDIRVYLSEDKTAKAFTEITSTVVNGNTKLEVPAAANTTTQKTVLIWCKQYSVLFGSAVLQ